MAVDLLTCFARDYADRNLLLSTGQLEPLVLQLLRQMQPSMAPILREHSVTLVTVFSEMHAFRRGLIVNADFGPLLARMATLIEPAIDHDNMVSILIALSFDPLGARLVHRHLRAYLLRRVDLVFSSPQVTHHNSPLLAIIATATLAHGLGISAPDDPLDPELSHRLALGAARLQHSQLGVIIDTWQGTHPPTGGPDGWSRQEVEVLTELQAEMSFSNLFEWLQLAESPHPHVRLVGLFALAVHLSCTGHRMQYLATPADVHSICRVLDAPASPETAPLLHGIRMLLPAGFQLCMWWTDTMAQTHLAQTLPAVRTLLLCARRQGILLPVELFWHICSFLRGRDLAGSPKANPKNPRPPRWVVDLGPEEEEEDFDDDDEEEEKEGGFETETGRHEQQARGQRQQLQQQSEEAKEEEEEEEEEDGEWEDVDEDDDETNE
jgi:hypothetical protein